MQTVIARGTQRFRQGEKMVTAREPQFALADSVIPTTVSPNESFEFEFDVQALDTDPGQFDIDSCIATGFQNGWEVDIQVRAGGQVIREVNRCIPFGDTREITGFITAGSEDFQVQLVVNGANSGTEYVRQRFDVTVSEGGVDGGGGGDNGGEESGSCSSVWDAIINPKCSFGQVAGTSTTLLIGGGAVMFLLLLIAVAGP